MLLPKWRSGFDIWNNDIGEFDISNGNDPDNIAIDVFMRNINCVEGFRSRGDVVRTVEGWSITNGGFCTLYGLPDLKYFHCMLADNEVCYS